MSPTDYASLWAAIKANLDCAPHIQTNEMPKISSSEAAAKDTAIAEILKASGFGATSRPVPAWQAKKLLIKRGKWRAIVQAAANDAHPAVTAAYSAVALAEDARIDADFLDPSAGVLLGALVSSGLLSADDRKAIEQLSVVPASITSADVSRAIRGPWE